MASTSTIRTRPVSDTAYATSLTRPTQCPTCLQREARILARENKVKETRLRWVVRFVVFALVIALASFAWVRFGADPMRSVQR